MNPLTLNQKRQPQGPGLPMPENPFDEALAQADARGAPQPPPVDAAPADAPQSAPPQSAPAPRAAPADQSQDLASAGITLPAQGTPKAHRAGDFTEREQGIHNPVLRTLAKIGDVAGSALLPGVTQFIPGTRLNEERGQAIDLGRQKEQAGIEQEQAATKEQEARAEGEPAKADESRARAESLRHPQPKLGTTPEEQFMQDALHGEGGQPRVNPVTGKPYDYLSAHAAWKQTEQDTKPDPAVKERDQDIHDVMKANNLPDTEVGRTQARTLIAQRAPAAHVAVTPPAESWQIAEGEHGQPVLYNTKTGEIKDTPTGLHAKGTAAAQKKDFDKNIAPIEAALNFADTYQNSGKFTGSDDDTLMLQYFEMAKPEAGFRLNTAEIQRQNQARSWRDSAEAFIRHATTGTWFSDDQRKQIVESMHHIGDAKKTARQGGGGGNNAQGGAGTIRARDPQGKLHEAPAGTALPTGWKLEKK